MQLTIHINNQEIQDIIDTLKDQGMDVTRAEVEAHIEDYIQGAIHDSRHERMDCVVDSLIDLQDWFLYTDRMQNKNNEELAENTGEFVDWLLDTVRDRMHKCAMINDRKSMGVLLELLNDIEDKLAEE